MVNTVLEVAGTVLIVAALVVIAVVCGTIAWEIGALVAAGEAAAVGGVLIALANARTRNVRSTL